MNQQPKLLQQDDGAVFTTRYHERGDSIVSAGPRYEFDVTKRLRQIEADTVQGLNEALIDTAYGAGEPNIAAWISTKRGLGQIKAVQPEQSAAPSGLAANGNPTPGARGARPAGVQPLLEQQGAGWMLRLTHADAESGYIRTSRPGGISHPVTEEMADYRQGVIDAHMTRLAQAAWSEREPEAMSFLRDLSVEHADDASADYGVSFAVERQQTNGNVLGLATPTLTPMTPRRPEPGAPRL
ncbi:MAG: hypothetical protein KI792_04560 [Alphaproteobacteria bacterium]|nr:hypothetical protein [Alphaproteobacteria bacterium SS10]